MVRSHKRGHAKPSITSIVAVLALCALAVSSSIGSVPLTGQVTNPVQPDGLAFRAHATPADALSTEPGNLITTNPAVWTVDSKYVEITPADPIRSAVRSVKDNRFYSDLIPVEPGKALIGSVWVRRFKAVPDKGGYFYYGIERYDSEGNPIGPNRGTEYFVAQKKEIPRDSEWHKYEGITILPLEHKPYEGSNGREVAYIRVRILANYQGATNTLWGGVMLRYANEGEVARPADVLDTSPEGNLLNPEYYTRWSADLPISNLSPTSDPIASGVESSSYDYYFSDFIPVTPGMTVTGSMWAKREQTAEDNAGFLYYGIERFDANKKPLNSNAGTEYFVVSRERVPRDSQWHKYEATTTIPTEHTPYNGSNGQGVEFIRARVLVNYLGATTTQWGGIQLYGSAPTGEDTELSIGIDGPAAQKYTRDTNDAVLANITMTTGSDTVDMKNIFIAIEAKNAENAGFGDGSQPQSDEIHEVLEDVELRNKATGRTIDAVRLTAVNASDGNYFTSATETFQIYRFDNLIVSNGDVWEFRADFIDNGTARHPQNGDEFRIHICGEPRYELVNGQLRTNIAGCNFGGLISQNTSYQMDVQNLATGTPVGIVRPRGNLTGNFHSISSATLNIAGQGIGSGDTAVKNQKNVNLLRFEARAGDGEDILATKFVFSAQAGALQNGQNYTLWVDSNNDRTVDTVLQTGVPAQSGVVSFGSIAGGGYVVPANNTIVFEVHTDIASNLTNNSLQLQFATASTYVEAEELDDGSSLAGISTNGQCASACDITVTTVESQPYTLVSQGDLFITKDSVPLMNRQLLGGSLAEAILRLQFHAENEDIDVTDLQLTASADSIKSIDRLELYKEGAVQPFAFATIAGCGTDPTPGDGTTFCANMEVQQLVIPEGADVDVLVRPRMKSDQQGAVSNEEITLVVVPTANAVQARGTVSSNTLSPNNGNNIAEGEIFIGVSYPGTNTPITGNTNVSVLSKITSITNANSDPNGTAIPEGPSRVIGKFKFAAAAHNNSKDGLNDVVLSGVILNVIANNMAITDTTMRLYNEEDSTVRAYCAEYDLQGNAISNYGSGSYFVSCTGLAESSVNTEIDQGSTITLVLQADVAQTQIGGNTSTLQVSLTNFSSINRKQFGFYPDSTHIQWIDAEGPITNDPVFTWIEYPTNTVSSTTYVSG